MKQIREELLQNPFFGNRFEIQFAGPDAPFRRLATPYVIEKCRVVGYTLGCFGFETSGWFVFDRNRDRLVADVTSYEAALAADRLLNGSFDPIEHLADADR